MDSQKARKAVFLVFYLQFPGTVREHLGERSGAVPAFDEIVKRRESKAFDGLHGGDLRKIEVVVLRLALVQEVVAVPVRAVHKPLPKLGKAVPFGIEERGDVMILFRSHEIHEEQHHEIVGNVGLIGVYFSAGTTVLVIVHERVGHIQDFPQGGAGHGIVRIGRVVEQGDIAQRVNRLHAQAGGLQLVVVPTRAAHGEAQVLVSHARPFLEVPGGNQVDRVFVREGIVAEIAHVLKRPDIPLQVLAAFPDRAAERQR